MSKAPEHEKFMKKAQYKTHLHLLLIFLCNQYKNHWDRSNKKKDYTIKDKNGMYTGESKEKIRHYFFPDDPLSLQLEVVICSTYTVSIQTSLEKRKKAFIVRSTGKERGSKAQMCLPDPGLRARFKGF